MSHRGTAHIKGKVLFVVVLLVILLLVGISALVYAFTGEEHNDESNVTFKEDQKIDVKIVDLNTEYMEIQITNQDTSSFKYTDYFLCKLKKEDAWKYVKFKRNVQFAKCVYELKSGQSKTRKIKWKDYFGHNLKDGQYQLLWIDRLDFEMNKNMKVGTDVEFVEQQFPKLQEIEKAGYYYYNKSNPREIGLQNIEFCGLLQIGEGFCDTLMKEYHWKETSQSKKVVPKAVLMGGKDPGYQFRYSDEFSNDGNYISHSWIGKFYLDPIQRVLYFECEW